MGIDPAHCVERYHIVKDSRASTCKRMLEEVEQWLREYEEIWMETSDKLNNPGEYTEGGGDALRQAADDIKRILEKIDG